MDLGHSPTSRILDLYQDLNGFQFQGIYRGIKEKMSPEGVSVRWHLVEVVSTHLKTKMDGIVACDPDDNVWKGIRDHTFWAASVTGQEPVKGSNGSYVLDKVKHDTQTIKWQKKTYSRVVNVYLKVVTP